MADSDLKETSSMPKTTYTMKTHIVTPLKDRRPRIILEVLETDLRTIGEIAAHAKRHERGTATAVTTASTTMATTLTGTGIGNGTGSGVSRFQRDTKIDILNSSSLMFHMKTNGGHDSCKRTMHFDCVANGAADQLIRWQMSSLVDRLLITGRNNCCLLRISPIRNTPTLHVLSHILIPEINKRLGSPEMSPLLLYAIRVEYYDVRKYDVVNMVLRAAPKKPRHHITFRNTWDLLHWVQEVFPSLWALGAGHECLDLKFVFIRDRSGAKVRVKLSILQFYLAKMDIDMVAGLRNFFENAGANSNARVKHSILTDYLREYFFSPENYYIWMVFEVPASKSTAIVSDVLTMASAAYAGVQGLIERKPKFETSLFSTKPDLEADILRPVINSTNLAVESSRSTTVKSSASNSAAQVALRFRKKEKQSLSYWYRQMDDKFINVLHTMETYYARKNKALNAESGGDSRVTTKIKERREFISTVRHPPRETLLTPDYALHTSTLNYKHAVNGLHTIMQQIERCPFARQLRMLIHMKNTELIQHLESLKYKPHAIQQPTKTKRSDKDTASIKSKASSNA